MEEDIQFIFGIIQSQEPLQELWKEWRRLLDKHSNPYSRIILLVKKEEKLFSCTFFFCQLTNKQSIKILNVSSFLLQNSTVKSSILIGQNGIA